MKRKFAVPSLLAAGFIPPSAAAAFPVIDKSKLSADGSPTLFEAFRLDHKYTLAGHRSHSSHSSHSSHRSSSGAGYLYIPPSTSVAPRSSAPSTYVAPNVPAPSYVVPSTAPAIPTNKPPQTVTSQPLLPLPGNTDKFKRIVMQVQMALVAYGYYKGSVDGVLGQDMRDAIQKMQTDYRISVTGTITPDLLNALRIVAD